MSKVLSFLKKYGLKIGFGMILILGISFLWYTSEYYRADAEALSVLSKSYVIEHNDYIELKADSDVGLIFYPGGKVEAYAYLVLLDSIRNEGVNVFLVKMPFKLAVFNINAATSILESHSNINKWYIAGHSLGGAMASQYLDKNADKFDGLIQLSAYPLNDKEEHVLIMFGSKDGVLDLDKMKNLNTFVIEGGNHAYFGNYGEQEGDGVASISRASQQAITVQAISDFIK